MYSINFPFIPPRMIKDGEVECVYESAEYWRGVAEAMRKAVENEKMECFIVCVFHDIRDPLCMDERTKYREKPFRVGI